MKFVFNRYLYEYCRTLNIPKLSQLVNHCQLLILPALKIKNHPHNGWFFHYLRMIQRYLTHNSNQTSGGVRGGTIRLLPVDSKAEATRSRLLSS